MTTRCVADLLSGKNNCVRFLVSIAVPDVPTIGNKVRRSLYLQRGFSAIFVGGRDCGKRLVAGATRSKLERMGIAVFNDFSMGKNKEPAECRER